MSLIYIIVKGGLQWFVQEPGDNYSIIGVYTSFAEANKYMQSRMLSMADQHPEWSKRRVGKNSYWISGNDYLGVICKPLHTKCQ